MPRYVPLVYSWCRRSGMQAQDAADVVQEVFRSVFQAIAAFRHERPGDTFRGWLRTIARNKIRDHFNRQAGRWPSGAPTPSSGRTIPPKAPPKAPPKTPPALPPKPWTA